MFTLNTRRCLACGALALELCGHANAFAGMISPQTPSPYTVITAQRVPPPDDGGDRDVSTDYVGNRPDFGVTATVHGNFFKIY